MKCKYQACSNEIENHSNVEKLFCSSKCKNKYGVDKQRWKLKFRAVALSGGKCIRCGYSRCITALEFHHRNPLDKLFAISHPHTRSWEKIKAEVEKCDLLCSNCHQEVEFKLKSEHKDFLQEFMGG